LGFAADGVFLTTTHSPLTTDGVFLTAAHSPLTAYGVFLTATTTAASHTGKPCTRCRR
jgi:hypothetical protein